MLQVNALDQVIVKNPNTLDYETSQHFQVKVGSWFLLVHVSRTKALLKIYVVKRIFKEKDVKHLQHFSYKAWKV